MQVDGSLAAAGHLGRQDHVATCDLGELVDQGPRSITQVRVVRQSYFCSRRRLAYSKTRIAKTANPRKQPRVEGSSAVILARPSVRILHRLHDGLDHFGIDGIAVEDFAAQRNPIRRHQPGPFATQNQSKITQTCSTWASRLSDLLARFFRRSVLDSRHGYQICERRSGDAHAIAAGLA